MSGRMGWFLLVELGRDGVTIVERQARASLGIYSGVLSRKRFSLTWTHRGFGSTLIERALGKEVKGVARMEFRPEGLRFALTMPLSL